MKRFFYFLFTALLIGCHDELPHSKEFPILQTLPPGGVDETGATFRADVLRHGGWNTSSYGFVWDTAEPNTATSNKVIVGDQLEGGSFEKRIDFSLSAGIEYIVRAFAIYGNQTVYGPSITFTSMGSARSPWTLLRSDVPLDGWSDAFGSATSRKGYLVFQSSDFYSFDPEDMTFSPVTPFPLPGNTGTQFVPLTIGETQYFFQNINRNLYRMADGKWSVQSSVPFSLGSFGGYYQGHVVGNKLFILSTYRSYSYDLTSDYWQQLPATPGPVGGGWSMGGVSHGNKAYVINTDKNIFEFDPDTNSWNLETAYPGRLEDDIVAFSHGEKIYFGLSSHDHHEPTNWMDKQFWSYHPVTNQWQQEENFPRELDAAGIFYFSLDNKLYIVHGFQSWDIWMFDPQQGV